MDFIKILLSLSVVATLNGLELEQIDVKESLPFISNYHFEEEMEVQSQSYSQKLLNNVNISQIGSATNSSVISIRGNNFRATEFYEDGIPLYRTANGFVDLSMYSDDSLTLDINTGASSSLYAPSATGGEMILNSKKLKNGLSGYINPSFSTNKNYFNSLVSFKSDDYYVKFVLNGMKQNSFKLSNDFSYTAMQVDDARVNADAKQLSGYLKVGYKLDSYLDIAFKFSHLKGEFGLPVNVYEDSTAPLFEAYTRMDDKELSSYWFYYDYSKNGTKVTLRAYYDEYKDIYNFYNTPLFDSFKIPTSTYYDDRLGAIASIGQQYTDKQNGLVTFNLERNRHKQVEYSKLENSQYEAIESYLAYLHNYIINDAFSIKPSMKYKVQYLTKAHNVNMADISYNNNKALDAQVVFNYAHGDDSSYYLSLARKNRFATLVELFPFLFSIPQSDVRPEKSDSIEVGTQFSMGDDTILKLALYYNNVDDMIVEQSNSFKNMEDVTMRGIDFSLYNYSIEDNEFELSYAYIDAEDKDGTKIDNIPTSKLNIKDRYSLNSDLDLLINYLYVDSVNDNYNSNVYTLSSYSFVDAQISYRYSKELNIKSGVKNMFDKNYYNRYGQPSSGREFFVDIRYFF